ncbi:GNAT family N-acetyltransferase [Candidatus Nitrosopelagicus sp.]|jgi:ribosomal-protein-alanine N-acetyltransferase|nr:GNAT family N-acetyltransferase [Candidatus Nitrosopelagicus sp.]|tara:strand:- start:4887 stop:5309 length:423 start_codon:yes stop_codon:yes gene_type:complete
MEIKLRQVSKEDWDYILELRNNFFKDDFIEQKKILTKKEHYEYMKNQKSNTNFHQWISSDGKNNVGYIRLLKDDVSIIVDQKFQNKGIGTKMLELMEKEARKIGLKKIKALVRKNNFSSEKIFLKNNYNVTTLMFEKEIE